MDAAMSANIHSLHTHLYTRCAQILSLSLSHTHTHTYTHTHTHTHTHTLYNCYSMMHERAIVNAFVLLSCVYSALASAMICFRSAMHSLLLSLFLYLSLSLS
jgi:hypothetical protein